MKTTSLLAAAVLSLPVGVMAAPAANDVSVAVTDEHADTKVVDLKVSNMK